MHIDADVAVVGSGLGGALMALLLERIGLRPVLLDRGSHPRFAIGESSTPIANLVLRDLARTYGLPRLEPLAKYGTWQATYPELGCGLKRGFSYFQHRPGGCFVPQADHAGELLVAASAEDRLGDTHWLRSDVDAFLVREVQSMGIPYVDHLDVSIKQQHPRWRLQGNRLGRPVVVTAGFLIDATGPGAFLPRALGMRVDAAGLKTESHAIYGHFTGVRPWRELLVSAGGDVSDHPFDCDHAALHHILPEGWMWQLRFNNGVTSAGFALQGSARSQPQRSPQEEWHRLLGTYPDLAEQFSQARLVQPPGGLVRTERLQRRAQQVAGENWALLPHTAGFIDPLHSTGIAHTLCGIERVIAMFANHWGQGALADGLARYARIVQAEIELIDELVSLCYASMEQFDLFTGAAMPYFAAATTYEQRRVAGKLSPGAAFLGADDAGVGTMVRRVRQHLDEALQEPLAASATARFAQAVAEAIAPLNTVGLCDAQARNMYRFTAAPIVEDTASA